MMDAGRRQHHVPAVPISPYQLGKWLPNNQVTRRPPSVVRQGIGYEFWGVANLWIRRATGIRIDQGYTAVEANRLMRCQPPGFRTSPDIFFRSLDWVTRSGKPMCLDEENDLLALTSLNRQAGFRPGLPRYRCAFCDGTRARLCPVPSPVVPAGFPDLWSAIGHIFNHHVEYTRSRKLRFLAAEARACTHVASAWEYILGRDYADSMAMLGRGEFPDTFYDVPSLPFSRDPD